MKKVVSLILVFAVALSLISCGGNETEQKTTGINTDNNQANASGGENLDPQYGGTLRVVKTVRVLLNSVFRGRYLTQILTAYCRVLKASYIRQTPESWSLVLPRHGNQMWKAAR